MTHPPAVLSPRSLSYLDTVRRQLSDLPPQDQADLLGQVEQRLHDLEGEDPLAISAQLGSAAEVAADLRAAAGFAPMQAEAITGAAIPGAAIPGAAIPGEAIPGGAIPGAAAPLPLAGTSAELLLAVTRHRALRPVVGYLVSLRPAWWAVRGYVLYAGLLAALSQGGGYQLHILGYYSQSFGAPPVHTSLAWLLPVVATVIASIALGLLTPRLHPGLGPLVTALNFAAIALIFAYPTWWLAPAFGSYTGLVS